ncbi:MAG: methyltransferase domain-containing protein [Oscillatoriales cyanobacterium RU_3_3]|nr:methyltransferase domain-containing protein [Microcoleus sp. SU_5_3]NJL66102.1 methyltransferase domain-containing protein [Microcoleus sp. SM1_3_4]NJM59085.1 methyltransferase domain-containing protein [Oscillatoriales cyanobacterium RU_3_3]
MSNTETYTEWDDRAEQYQAYFDDPSEKVSSTTVFPRMLQIIGNIEGKKVLDFGCSMGRFSRIMHDMGAMVTGYDLSPKAVEIAKSMDSKRNIEYFSRQEDLKENYYEIVICTMVLLCNPKAQAFQLVNDIYTYTKPGGIVGFVNTNVATLGRSFPNFYSQVPQEQKEGSPYQTRIPTPKGELVVTDYFYTPEYLKQMFKNNKFQLQGEEIIAEQFILHILKKN